MAGRIRTLKPEILEKARTAELSDEAWRLFVSMILMADDHGNLDGHPNRLRAEAFWGASPSRDLRESLATLETRDLIQRYSVRGQQFIAIVGWKEHQKVDHPGKPRVPSLDRDDGTVPTHNSRDSRDDLGNDLYLRPPISDPDLRSPTPPSADSDSDAGKPDPGGVQEGLTLIPDEKPSPFDFEAVYSVYPRKEGKKKGLQRCRKAIKTRAKYDALLLAVANYTLTVEGREPDKIKHFDSFMSVWEDYVNHQPLKSHAGSAHVSSTTPETKALRKGSSW